LCEIFVDRKLHKRKAQILILPSSFVRRRLHELDCYSVRVANIDHTLSGVRSSFQGLGFPSRSPTGRRNGAEHSVKIIYRQRNMHGSDIARSKIDMFSVRWGMVLEQFDLVSVAFENGEGNLSSGHASDFTGKIACVMRPMRKFEAENILPEGERPLTIRHCETSVISGNDAKRHTHAVSTVVAGVPPAESLIAAGTAATQKNNGTRQSASLHSEIYFIRDIRG
jgi:hypothetical protein